MADNDGSEHAASALLELNGVDRRWLETVLADRGFGGSLRAIEPGLVGTGQVGENVRCRLRWAGPDPGSARPDSVVIKLASANATSREAARATSTYIREVGFYRDVAPTVAIRVPTVHHVSEDRAANRFVLVMEDITPAVAGDQLRGCSLDQAALAIEAAADLHGSTWGRGELAELDWIDDDREARVGERVELFRMLCSGFFARYEDRLSAEDREFGRWLEARFFEWQSTRTDRQCLVHGDFRLDNLLFGTGDPAPPLTTVDWQTPSLGPALGDVAYFLSGSLDPVTRRTHEQDLLRRYRARLSDHGVALAEDEAWRQYRLAAPAGYVMAVLASQLVGRTERGDEMFMVMARGSAAQARDLDTPSLVD